MHSVFEVELVSKELNHLAEDLYGHANTNVQGASVQNDKFKTMV